MLTKAVVPFARAVRNCHHAPAKFTGQTPTSFIHDGWANAVSQQVSLLVVWKLGGLFFTK
ncbi:hypothetical protein ANCDUO_18883 [Ancylostoma duodenale]|uniref:Uncharacterized protein n=1 Tax=Ancylostoma duodenale TaxID=51022 RepID=A0A0C2FWM6_9BILA|nr:hypothetical protein ANCDUO_18883 [Ancylostoma duodenale]